MMSETTDVPVAYLHVLHMELGQTHREVTFDRRHPFGTRGRHYSRSFKITTTPLYAREEPAHVNQ